MNEAESKALSWLKDENAIQRNKRHERSGKISVTEHDVSGGQSALMPSKPDEIKEACRHAYEVHDIGPKIEQERKHPRAKPPQVAAGTKQRKPLLNDSINMIAEENKIGRTKASSLRKTYRNHLKNKKK